MRWLSLFMPVLVGAGVIHPDLQAQLDGQGTVEALVVYTDQVELKTLEGKTPQEIVGLLQDVAEVSQRRSRALLQQYAAQVEQWQAFWAVNALYVVASPDVIRSLAALPEVREIRSVRRDYHVLGAPSKKGKTPPRIQTVEWNISKIKADSVWYQYGLSGQGVIVGVLDTGIDPSHPALSGNFSGYFLDAVNNQSTPYDDHGHGTHVSGTIAGGDGPGSFADDIGIAYNAQIASCKAFSSSGSGSDVDIIECVQWFDSLKGAGVDIKAVNNSWGGGGGDTWLWNDLWTGWRALGIIPVFAAGNSGPGTATVGSPGDYPIVIAVGATDNGDNIASFSSRGPAPDTGLYADTTYWSRPDWNYIKPDVSAPGAGIRSSLPGGGYDTWDGTSMATPHVTGVLALMFELNPTLDYATIYDILTNYGVDQPSQGGTYPNNDYGWGRINALKIIENTPTLNAPFVKVQGYTVDDASGNGDGIADPGESVVFYVRLRNLGLDATNVNATLSVLPPADTAVTITDNTSAYGTLVQGDTSSGDGFAFSVDTTWRDGVPAQFVVSITADGGYSRTETLSVQLGRPAYYTWFQYDFSTMGPWTGGWALTTADYNSPPSSLTDSPGGSYGDNQHNYVVHAQPFDLSDAYFARIIFSHKYDIESGYDFGYVQVATDTSDGASWTTLASYSGSQVTWTPETLQIPNSFMGQTVYVRFLLETDGSVTRDGWYVDDVVLQKDVPLTGVVMISVGTAVADTSAGSNGNGVIDPGEGGTLTWVLTNIGSDTALNVTANITSSLSGLTIGNTPQTLPAIYPGDTVSLVFSVQADPSIPMGSVADLTLTLNGTNLVDTQHTSLIIGRRFWTPDIAGGPYIALDNTDLAYTTHAPTYNWIDISATGTPLTLTDDDREPVALPFSFPFYGVLYDTIWVCSNGWIAFGSDPGTNDFSNDPIGDTTTPDVFVAGLWDDLNPATGGQILYAYDATQGIFVVSFIDVPHYGASGDLERFQVILRDPAVYPTPDGNGEILVQYDRTPAQTDFTAGIEYDNGSTVYGVAYAVDGTYYQGAEVIDSGRAILYTSQPVDVAETGPAKPASLQFAVRPVVRGQAEVILTLPTAQNVEVRVFDALGRKVQTLFRGRLEAGIHRIRGNLRVPSGIYFFQLVTPQKNLTRRTLVLR